MFSRFTLPLKAQGLISNLQTNQSPPASRRQALLGSIVSLHMRVTSFVINDRMLFASRPSYGLLGN